MVLLIIMGVSCLVSVVCCLVALASAATNTQDDKCGNWGIIFFIICVASIDFAFYPHQKISFYERQYDIYAIEDTTMIKGSRWYFEEDFKYYYFASYKDGKKMYHVDKGDAYIVEVDGVQPHIEVFREQYTSKVIQWIKNGYDLNTEYKIVVPPNTVTNEFNIDMKK